MDRKLLGYRKGFVYFQIGRNVYRGDYADYTALRWYSTLAGMEADIRAYGKLSDENGNDIDLII